MKLSQFTISHLAKAVCGDSYFTPYLRGFELVNLFNNYGFNDVYEQGFPSRCVYTESKLNSLNNTEAIRTVVQDIVDPRRFIGIDLDVEESVSKLNEFLHFDNVCLVRTGNSYKLLSMDVAKVIPETTKLINHEFIIEQISKCEHKIAEGDYNGAITNARSLLEAIFIDIIERYHDDVKNDGDLGNLWRSVKNVMNIKIDKSTMPDYVIQILSGIESSLKGLAGLSNNASDRHANKFHTRKHHAKLAVNLSMTISDFLLDSWNFKNEHIE